MEEDELNASDTAFMFLSTALVMFMTPGLAFFYSGLVHSSSILSVFMQGFASIALLMVVWYCVGFSLTHGSSLYGLIGNPVDFIFWRGLKIYAPFVRDGTVVSPGFPGVIFAMYHTMFASVAPALLGGALLGRLRFSSYLLFIVLWSLLVYAPVGHWTWGGGWLFQLGSRDFAGGCVVHMTTGFSGLAGIFMLGNRDAFATFRQELKTPHNLPFVVLGTSMLWFGWFGFNGGSAMSDSGLSVIAFVNTHMAASIGSLAWLFLRWFESGQPKLSGACAGCVAGLVAITPAAGFLQIWGSILVGSLASLCCFFAVKLADYLDLDDALDVWALHGVGGFVGTVALGILADGQECAYPATAPPYCVNPGTVHRSMRQAGVQVTAAVITATHSIIVTAGILKAMSFIGATRPPNVASNRWLSDGLDLEEHGESAYAFENGMHSEQETLSHRGSCMAVARVRNSVLLGLGTVGSIETFASPMRDEGIVKRWSVSESWTDIVDERHQAREVELSCLRHRGLPRLQLQDALASATNISHDSADEGVQSESADASSGDVEYGVK